MKNKFDEEKKSFHEIHRENPLQSFHPIHHAAWKAFQQQPNKKERKQHQPHYHKNQVGFILRNMIQEPKHIGRFSPSLVHITRIISLNYFALIAVSASRWESRMPQFLAWCQNQKYKWMKEPKRKHVIQTLQLKLHVTLRTKYKHMIYL